MLTSIMLLLEEKSFSEITVSEITKKAGVSRMTFYRNYKVKEDIFSDHLTTILKEYYEGVSSMENYGDFYSLNNLIHCFIYFSKHKPFIQCLLGRGFGHIFTKGIRNYIITIWYKETDKIDRFYELQAFAGSLVSVFEAWVERDSKETPEELAGILHKLYNKKFNFQKILLLYERF